MQDRDTVGELQDLQGTRAMHGEETDEARVCGVSAESDGKHGSGEVGQFQVNDRGDLCKGISVIKGRWWVREGEKGGMVIRRTYPNCDAKSNRDTLNPEFISTISK